MGAEYADGGGSIRRFAQRVERHHVGWPSQAVCSAREIARDINEDALGRPYPSIYFTGRVRRPLHGTLEDFLRDGIRRPAWEDCPTKFRIRRRPGKTVLQNSSPRFQARLAFFHVCLPLEECDSFVSRRFRPSSCGHRTILGHRLNGQSEGHRFAPQAIVRGLGPRSRDNSPLRHGPGWRPCILLLAVHARRAGGSLIRMQEGDRGDPCQLQRIENPRTRLTDAKPLIGESYPVTPPTSRREGRM